MPSKSKSLTPVLVVAAHPDDETLGCGGTIARLTREGVPLHLFILGDGVSSRYPRRSGVDSKALRRLKVHARQAAQLLGAKSIRFEDLPDNRFDELPLLEIVKKVERVVDELRPGIIFTHHPGDLNVDHRMTFQAVLTATRPTNGCSVKELYTFEIPSSTEWAFQQLEPVFKPNVFMDVSHSIETKIQAVKRYRSESRAFPHPRSPQALRMAARRWGSVVGINDAEAFELVRALR